MVITPEIYKYYWGRTTESTSSVWAKIHFGHWKAIRYSDKLTHLTCTQLNLIALTGSPLSQWGNGLQVLLKKFPGVALVDKLCEILLMEGDFNFFY
jgi:hypothetical protein